MKKQWPELPLKSRKADPLDPLQESSAEFTGSLADEITNSPLRPPKGIVIRDIEAPAEESSPIKEHRTGGLDVNAEDGALETLVEKWKRLADEAYDPEQAI